KTFLSVFSARTSAVRTAGALAFAPSSGTALALAHSRFINRIGASAASHGSLGIQYFAAINPDLYANLTKRRFRFSQAVVYVGSKRVQRQLPLQMPLAPGYFSSIQSTADFHLDSLSAKSE